MPFDISGKQIINNAQEIIIPKLKGWWQNFSVSIVGFMKMIIN